MHSHLLNDQVQKYDPWVKVFRVKITVTCKFVAGAHEQKPKLNIKDERVKEMAPPLPRFCCGIHVGWFLHKQHKGLDPFCVELTFCPAADVTVWVVFSSHTCSLSVLRERNLNSLAWIAWLPMSILIISVGTCIQVPPLTITPSKQ